MRKCLCLSVQVMPVFIPVLFLTGLFHALLAVSVSECIAVLLIKIKFMFLQVT